METFSFLGAYLAKVAILGVAAYGMGSIMWRRTQRSALAGSIASVLKLLHGFGILGLIALALGLAGWLQPRALQIVLALGVLIGFVAIGRSLRGVDSPFRKLRIPSFPRLAIYHWVAFAVCVAAALNVTVGALAPDAAQDSLWYHLSCARAWLHWHRPLAWPTVFPSGYALHASLLYAYALSLGDEIDCSVLYALSGFLTFLIAAMFARKWFGWKAALWSWFLCATAFATHQWFVPIHSGSDLFATMFATAGMLTILDALADPDAPRRSYEIRAAGWLLGWAVVTKLTALGYAVLPVTLLLFVTALLNWGRTSQGPTGDKKPLPCTFLDVVAFLSVAAVPVIIWGVRNISMGTGNPIFPLFRDLLPLKPEFSICRRNLAVNTVYPLSWDGLRMAFGNIAQKLEFLTTPRSPAFLFHAAVTCWGLFSREPSWRAIGFLGVIQWIIFFWTAGYNEIVRYFSLVYPTHFVFVGAAIARFEGWPALRPQLKQFALLAFIALLGYVYALRQYEWGSYHTVAWPYRPILRHEERLAYLATKQYQLANIYLYDAANRTLPADAGVLFPECAYPFYVDRRYLWVDDDLNFYDYLNDLGVRDETDLRLYLADHRVTHVIMSSSSLERYPIWKAVLEKVELPATSSPACLYRVR
jgi:hypothetical protein